MAETVKPPTVIGKEVTIEDKKYLVLRVYCIGHKVFNTKPHYVYSTWEAAIDKTYFGHTTMYNNTLYGQLIYKFVPELADIQRFKKEIWEHTYQAIDIASPKAKEKGLQKQGFVYVNID